MLYGEHGVVYGQPCIVTAVNQRLTVMVEKIVGSNVTITAPDLGVKDFKYNRSQKPPTEMKFISSALNIFSDNAHKINLGLKITTKNEFSSKFGFGSSSAVTVALLKALLEIFEIKTTNKELFDLAYKTVLAVQGVGSGFDLAAAIWGGTLYFTSGGKKIMPLKIGALPLVVGYTGIKADTSLLIKFVAEKRKQNPKLIDNIFNSMGQIVEKAKIEFKKNDLVAAGELMNINQGLLDALGVNTLELSQLIFAARNGGALGAKLSGAGGGDCMIALKTNGNDSVESAIKMKGGIIINVSTNADGIRIESNS